MMSENSNVALDKLIDQLYESDRYIDLDLMAAIMAQGQAVVDQLIEAVEHNDDWPGVHAMLMLIEMRAEKALPAISQVLLEVPGLNEWLDTDGLDKYGPVAIDTLEMMVNEKTADWYPRALAASALARIAARYSDTYERITAILRSLLPDPSDTWEGASAVENPEIWPSAVSNLAQLRDPRAYELIGQLFEGDWIDLSTINREDYDGLYQSTDPLYEVMPAPRDLLSSHRFMQERWKRSEAKSTKTVRPVRPSGQDKRKARRQARKSQTKARRKQRKKSKKKKKR